MNLKKRIDDTHVVAARYLEKGIALCLTREGDNYLNTIASIELVDGKPTLVLFDDAIQQYGLGIEHQNIDPEKW